MMTTYDDNYDDDDDDNTWRWPERTSPPQDQRWLWPTNRLHGLSQSIFMNILIINILIIDILIINTTTLMSMPLDNFDVLPSSHVPPLAWSTPSFHHYNHTCCIPIKPSLQWYQMINQRRRRDLGWFPSCFSHPMPTHTGGDFHCHIAIANEHIRGLFISFFQIKMNNILSWTESKCFIFPL